MSAKSKDPVRGPCQLFEFLMKTTGGAQCFAYALPVEDADRISEFFAQFDAMAGDEFIEFACDDGRVVHLNRRFLVAFSRLDLQGLGDAPRLAPAPAIETGSGLGARAMRPDLIVVIDGLSEPLVCTELARDHLDLVARTLHTGPSADVVHFPDIENLRTRFIPARNIILMECVEYLPDSAQE